MTSLPEVPPGSGAPPGAASADRETVPKPRRPVLHWALLVTVVSLIAGGVGGAFWMLRGIHPAPADPYPTVSSFTQVTSSGSTLPSLSPDGQWIAFAGASSGNFDVYLQNVDSPGAINLTSDSKSNDTEPAFSPDGERIAFRSARQGGGIFVMTRGGKDPQRLTDFGYSPAWSPDGRYLAVASEVAVTPDAGPLASVIWIVTVASGEKRQLETGEALAPHWSPHRLRVAYSGASETGRRSIWSVTVAGRATRQLTTHPSHTTFSDWDPVWSPDGGAVYFLSDRSGKRNLWTIRVDEESGAPLGEPRPLTVPGDVTSIAISGDGAHLACAWTSGSSNIQRLSIDRNSAAAIDDPERVTQDGVTPTSVAASPDGEWAVFSSGPSPEHLFVIGSDGSGLCQVSAGLGADLDPLWSPDGRQIVFSDVTAAGGQLKIMGRDGSGIETMCEERGWRHPVWSRDGSRVAAVNRNGEIGLFDAGTRGTPPGVRYLLPAVRQSASRGTVPLLWDWSPDMTLLAGEDSSGPFVYNVTSQECVGLVGFSGPSAFMPDSRRLLVADSRGKLLLVDSATSEQSEVLSVAPDHLAGMSLSRDGRHVFILRVSDRREISIATLSNATR